MGRLDGKKIAFLVADQTHDEELNFPRYWLAWEGAEITLAGMAKEHLSRFGQRISPDILTSELGRHQFDAVVIPGGFGPDKLRTDKDVLEFVRQMFNEGKIVAAICHAGWVLVSAGIVRGRRLTCVKNIADDVKNAGGLYEDSPLVRDGNLITSRLPIDLPAFTAAIVEALSEVRVEAKPRRA